MFKNKAPSHQSVNFHKLLKLSISIKQWLVKKGFLCTAEHGARRIVAGSRHDLVHAVCLLHGGYSAGKDAVLGRILGSGGIQEHGLSADISHGIVSIHDRGLPVNALLGELP